MVVANNSDLMVYSRGRHKDYMLSSQIYSTLDLIGHSNNMLGHARHLT